jgi:Rieske 2Fe-2S family protein
MVMRPNCFISLLPDHAIVHRFEVVSTEVTRVVCEWLFPPETLEGKYDLTDTVELFHRVNQQDFAASEWCQPNMKSRAYRDGGVLVPTEQEIIGRWYYRWYREAMGLDATGLGEQP